MLPARRRGEPAKKGLHHNCSFCAPFSASSSDVVHYVPACHGYKGSRLGAAVSARSRTSPSGTSSGVPGSDWLPGGYAHDLDAEGEMPAPASGPRIKRGASVLPG